MRPKFSVLLKTIFLFLVIFFLLLSFAFDFSNPELGVPKWIPSSGGQSTHDTEKLSKESAAASRLHAPIETTTASIENASPTASPSPASNPILKDVNATLLKMAPAYIKAIMNPEDKTFPRLDCPVPSDQRYRHLKANSTDMPQGSTTTARPKYFFALDLNQRASLLPRLFGSIVESMRFLGPQNCALSVIEGRSDDGTFGTYFRSLSYLF